VEVEKGVDVVERLDTRVDFTRPDDDEPNSFDLWDSGGELDQQDSDEVRAILHGSRCPSVTLAHRRPGS
jgi:hypothetical protein